MSSYLKKITLQSVVENTFFSDSSCQQSASYHPVLKEALLFNKSISIDLFKKLYSKKLPVKKASAVVYLQSQKGSLDRFEKFLHVLSYDKRKAVSKELCRSQLNELVPDSVVRELLIAVNNKHKSWRQFVWALGHFMRAGLISEVFFKELSVLLSTATMLAGIAARGFTPSAAALFAAKDLHFDSVGCAVSGVASLFSLEKDAFQFAFENYDSSVFWDREVCSSVFLEEKDALEIVSLSPCFIKDISEYEQLVFLQRKLRRFNGILNNPVLFSKEVYEKMQHSLKLIETTVDFDKHVWPLYTLRDLQSVSAAVVSMLKNYDHLDKDVHAWSFNKTEAVLISFVQRFLNNEKLPLPFENKSALKNFLIYRLTSILLDIPEHLYPCARYQKYDAFLTKLTGTGFKKEPLVKKTVFSNEEILLFTMELTAESFNALVQFLKQFLFTFDDWQLFCSLAQSDNSITVANILDMMKALNK